MPFLQCVMVGLCVWLFTSVGRAENAAHAASSSSPLSAEVRPARAPRAYGVSVGGVYTFRSELPLAKRASPEDVRPAGLCVGGRLGWQIGGLDGSAPTSIGFEADFLYQAAARARSSYGLLYGVFIKHAFGTGLRVRPFFSYGLGAAQVWIAEVGGRGIGHATRLSMGIATRLKPALHLDLALSYQGIFMPRFELDTASPEHTNFHSAVVSTGLWFGN